ncbi:MAG: ATP-binding cassette domain-containing protein [Arcicella sp.]|nr:ATP-binding cassette domain-containing protein [Arcicella sp.]
MQNINHAIFLSNQANKTALIQQILSQKSIGELVVFNKLKGILFSISAIQTILDDEERHGFTEVTKHLNRSLKSMSSGERMKTLLDFVIAQKPDFIVLDNPFDNLDLQAQMYLKEVLAINSTTIPMIQILHRERDLLPFMTNYYTLDNDYKLLHHVDKQGFIDNFKVIENHFSHKIPPPIQAVKFEGEELISMKNVRVTYNEKVIFENLSWTIKKGEFWHLVGPNGSGKTTILSMITGDNPKGYGQDLTLFGRKKGSGESIWEVKEKIGYITPSMTDLFSSRHTLEQMIISGFYDSIGLYVQPSDLEIKTANLWLELVGMGKISSKLFCLLSTGQQRMALIIRTMVKHPPLLILDEALAGLDEHNTSLSVALINKIASESDTTIIYVSHRKEEGLNPKNIFELK